ncbi:MAG: hypothetical protein HKN33_14645 [Pyrinomonadaceae bacterium]|nr:hypothetical protein [Pyrinomonadaceae bacterium]
MNTDFYIGYLPKMPAFVKRLIKPFVFTLFFAGLILAVLFASGQKPFANSVFEFGNARRFEGTVQARPVPFLLVEKTQTNNGLPTFFRYPLVGEGKYGVGDDIVGADGKKVSLEGTLIYRDGLRLIEVVSGSMKTISRSAESPSAVAESLGSMALRGEIIDSKCYLGVMNPGNTKVHRDCAVACIRGGVPAMFLVKDSKGNKSELWLLSEDGRTPNSEILDYVAEPVELRGRVTRVGAQLFFYADLSKIKRL